jgi:hydroxymethylglutaryl-CoA synthase
VRSWETRFITQGYVRLVRETVAGVLKKTGLGPKDFSKVVLYSPDPRSVDALAKSLGFDTQRQLQDTFFDAMGNTGTPYCLQLLVAALEDAKAGDRILLASYGNGGDAFVLQVTENVEKLKNRNLMSKLLASKKVLPDYITYLKWREFLDTTPLHTRPTPVVSATSWMRERSAIIPFHAGKCKNCGYVQYPPQRICSKCRTRDHFEEVRISDKKATLFSYSMDMVSSQVDLPLVYSVVNFEGGGRIITTVTDKEPEDIKTGMELQMTFRKLFTSEGYTHYFWKAMPIR